MTRRATELVSARRASASTRRGRRRRTASSCCWWRRLCARRRRRGGVEQHGARAAVQRANNPYAGLPWKAIATRLGSRTSEQCRSTWLRRLAPHVKSYSGMANWYECDDGGRGLASDITLLAGIRDSGGKHACDVLWNSLGATFGGSEAAKRRARKLFSKYLPASDPGIDSYSPAAGPLCERAGRALESLEQGQLATPHASDEDEDEEDEEEEEEEAPPPMSEAEAEAGAAAEGLELLRSERNSTGYQFVFNCSKPGKPFQAKLKDSTGQEHLGYFGSAHEAALAVAAPPLRAQAQERCRARGEARAEEEGARGGEARGEAGGEEEGARGGRPTTAATTTSCRSGSLSGGAAARRRRRRRRVRSGARPLPSGATIPCRATRRRAAPMTTTTTTTTTTTRRSRWRSGRAGATPCLVPSPRRSPRRRRRARWRSPRRSPRRRGRRPRRRKAPTAATTTSCRRAGARRRCAGAGAGGRRGAVGGVAVAGGGAAARLESRGSGRAAERQEVLRLPRAGGREVQLGGEGVAEAPLDSSRCLVVGASRRLLGRRAGRAHSGGLGTTTWCTCA